MLYLSNFQCLHPVPIHPFPVAVWKIVSYPKSLKKRWKKPFGENPSPTNNSSTQVYSSLSQIPNLCISKNKLHHCFTNYAIWLNVRELRGASVSRKAYWKRWEALLARAASIKAGSRPGLATDAVSIWWKLDASAMWRSVSQGDLLQALAS